MDRNRRRIPLLSALYRQYLDNQDSDGFAVKVSKCYSPGTLERLTCHGDREVRRAAVLVLGFVGDYSVNHTVGRALLDDDRTVRLLAENGIRKIWARDGSPAERKQLDIIMRLNASGRYRDAARRATELLERAPWFAEVWNQRAVARFNLHKHAESIRDCHQALEMNPYHFVAATSMGRSYLELDNQVSALESFRRALRLNGDLEGVRAQVVRLARTVEGKEK